MRVNLLFGFLGSGKTTLARRLIEEGARDQKMAVIVNEFGDVGIDGTILKGEDLDMIELTSGCLCCTLRGSLLNAVEELNAKKNIDVVVIEATGVAEPEEMIETFSDVTLKDRYEMGPMVTVIDVPKFTRLREMLGPFYEAQVLNADILVLNKVDLATAADIDTARQAIVVLNPRAELFFTEQCELDVNLILAGATSWKMADYLRARDPLSSRAKPRELNNDDGHGDAIHHDVHDHRHAPAQSFVLDSSGAVSRHGVEMFCAGLPENVWRIKGYTVIDGAPSLIQYTMGQLDITLADAREHHHIVFIGSDINREAIELAFSRVFKNVDVQGGPG
jgi:G3E family GTPase